MRRVPGFSTVILAFAGWACGVPSMGFAQTTTATLPAARSGEISADPMDPAAWTDTGKKIDALLGERYYGVYAKAIKLGYVRHALEKKQIGTVNCYKSEQEIVLLDPKLGERGRVQTYLFSADAPWDLLERANLEKVGPKTMATNKEWREGEEWKVERTVGDRKLPTQSFKDPALRLAQHYALELWAMREPQVGEILVSKSFDNASRLVVDQHGIKRVAEDGKGGKLYIISSVAGKGGMKESTVSEKGEMLEIRTDEFVMRAEPAKQAQDLTATQEMFSKMPRK